MGETEFPDPRPYVRIANMIREQIVDGSLRPGQALPSITVIQRETGHSRLTISKAMSVLVGEGLIFRSPGYPYYVTRHNDRTSEPSA